MKKCHEQLFRFALLLSLLLLPSATKAVESKKLGTYIQNLTTFSKEYPQEKVYLHFDNTTYFLSETIWFKSYVVRADRNSLSQFSGVLYVELVNAEGYVLETRKLKIEDGQCSGDFKLIGTNYPGFYEVRAYTAYMMNFGKENYFSRVFPVYDKPKVPGEFKTSITERPQSQRIPLMRPELDFKNKINTSFFPEGGNLVEGISSTVAFKAFARDGSNAAISGTVFNDKKEKVAEFSSEFQGMGKFDFTPGQGKYTAKVQYEDKDYEFELPAVQAKGFTMAVDNSNQDTINILVQKNVATLNETLGLSITCRGQLYGSQQITLGNENIVSFSLPNKMLPSGVSQITLFNSNGEILSERLLFVNHQSQLKMQLTQNQATIKPYEPISLTFDLKDGRNNPVETSFSLSVRDASTCSINPYSNNVLTDLLLSSEIKGYIEHPNYYFESNDLARRTALDLLLMTQGWTRYSWKQMAGVEPFVVKHPIEEGLVIDGSVVSLILKKKMKDVDITMALIHDETSQRGKCQTDSIGNFNFSLQDFQGDGKLLLQSKQNSKRKEMRIMLNRNLITNFRPYAPEELKTVQYFKTVRDTIMTADSLTADVKEDMERYLPKNNSNLSMEKRNNLLKEVTVKEKRAPIKVNIKYDLVREMDKIRDMGDWQPAGIFELMGKLNKYFIYSTNENGEFNCSYRNKNVVFIRDDSKMAVSDINSLITDGETTGSDTPEAMRNRNSWRMPLLDEIESITLIEDYSSMIRIYNATFDPSKNVIALIRCKKNYRPEPYGIRNTPFAGYSYTKEFFSPDYSSKNLPEENDYRRTLYWNPNVKTNAAGKATVNFYNNGSCKAINVNAETVTENGMMGAINK